MSDAVAAITAALAAAGLAWRGAFHPAAEDGVPAIFENCPARTVVLAGTIGRSVWPSFAAAPEASDGAPHPLDRWSRRVLTEIAHRLDAAPIFPFGGPPHLPFQRWAARAEPVAPSPIGILIHPEYGLWHSYRGALLFARQLDLPLRPERPRPCDSCVDKPCLSACPVGAFTGTTFEASRCLNHITEPAGDACRSHGCGARLACPVGGDLAHGPDQARFHMDAFVAAQVAPSLKPVART